MVNYLPLGPESANKTRFVVEGSSPSATGTFPVAEVRSTNPDYFRAMGIPLVKGRFFTDQEKQPVIIISETVARRFFPHQDPIGKRINTGPLGPEPFWFVIVGVVGDIREFGLADRPAFDLYFESFDSEMCLAVRTTSDTSSLAASVQHEVRSLDKDVPVSSVMTMEEILSHSLSSRRFSMLLLGIFAALALILAAVGIYGVTSYTATQRAPEIGIRMALGARQNNVLRLVVGQGLRLVVAGLALGLAAALAVTRLMSNMLYGVSASDPATFAGASVLLAGVGLVASYVPARRATTLDPIAVLRQE
jgi:putative ABC transport system permease protein